MPDRRLRILTGRSLERVFADVLPGLPDESFLIEPRAKGTAPALAWAAHRVARDDPDAVLVSLHADHVVDPVDAFEETVLSAVEVAEREHLLVTIGAPPDRPETGYGYIQPGDRLPDTDRACRIRAFHEKPDEETASRYVDEGYLWNTGIFVWRAADVLAELSEHTPELATSLGLLDEGDVEGFFAEVPACTIDVVLMERTRKAAVVPARFAWDDVGAWHSLARTRAGDASGNIVIGEGFVEDGADNIVFSEDGRVVLFGVEGLVVVRSGETTLVTRRDRSADLKTLLSALPPEYRE